MTVRERAARRTTVGQLASRQLAVRQMTARQLAERQDALRKIVERQTAERRTEGRQGPPRQRTNSVPRNRPVETPREFSDQSWQILKPFLPLWKGTGRPPVDMRSTMEGIAWRIRADVPWRKVPRRFGYWNTIYKRYGGWLKDGTWARLVTALNELDTPPADLAWITADTAAAPAEDWLPTVRDGITGGAFTFVNGAFGYETLKAS